jgi:hypothetical protein
MKTAVEWLKDVIESFGNKHELQMSWDTFDEVIEQAKEMEKEQMLNAFQKSRLTHPMIGFKHETFVEYYKQFKQQEQ